MNIYPFIVKLYIDDHYYKCYKNYRYLFTQNIQQIYIDLVQNRATLKRKREPYYKKRRKNNNEADSNNNDDSKSKKPRRKKIEVNGS